MLKELGGWEGHGGCRAAGGIHGLGGPRGARSGPGPGGASGWDQDCGIAWQWGPMAHAGVNAEAVRFAISPGACDKLTDEKHLYVHLFCIYSGGRPKTRNCFLRGKKQFRVFGRREKQLVAHLHVHLVLCSRTAS